MLSPLTDAPRIARALRRVERALAGARLHDVELRWQGGRAVVSLQWRAAERLWWHLGGTAADRWWFVLGHGPQPGGEATPSCEINMPKSGHDRRLAGAILRDDSGELYLAHSGRVGGGHRGADKDAFRRFLVPGLWQGVRWPDGAESELYLAGHIGSPCFARQLGRFVREVHRFKNRAVDPAIPQPAPLPGGSDPAAPLPASCDLGLVLDALDDELRRRGADRAGDDAGDLFAHRFRGQRRIIELSCDVSEDGLHRLLGRLLLRGCEHEPPARLLAVLPRELPSWAEAGIGKLGIRLVRFGWRGDKVQFDSLDGALG